MDKYFRDLFVPLIVSETFPNFSAVCAKLSKRNRSVLVYPLAPIWVEPWPFFFSGVAEIS